LPNLWFSVDLLTENGDLIDSILIDADQVGTGGTLEIDYSATYADPIYSHTAYVIGFDESDLFYILLNLSTVLVCSLVFMVIDKSGFARDWKTFRAAPGRHIGMIIGGWVMVYAALFIASLILQIIGISDPSANENAIAGMFSTDPLSISLLFLLLCVFTPIAEELVFRKVIYGFLDRKWGVVPAVMLSGAVFGLMHVIAYGDFIQSIPYIFMGSVFGYVYHWSAKNIYVTIGVHFINNLISFLLYVFLAFGLSI
jgi:membrane protease YdiL (CAAX protease family)